MGGINMSDKKVILISIDGMRPDGVKQCGNKYADELIKKASYTFSARTVFPSITLPCHLSMFLSVPPERHGTLSNTYAVQVRPVNGLFEQLKLFGKKSFMYAGWQPIRNISRDESLTMSKFVHALSFDGSVDTMLTDMAIEDIKKYKPDFVFLYMVETDDKGGHDKGWMSGEYLKYLSCALDNAKRVQELFGDEYEIVITADHGGHDRMHGTEMPEDMTIPMFYIGESFETGVDLGQISILDIAPTIADVMGITKAPEWEGKSVVNRK